MRLTDREKEQLKTMIDAGQPLPPRYKAVLFDQPHEAGRKFHALFVRQEDWESHKLTNFGQLVRVCG